MKKELFLVLVALFALGLSPAGCKKKNAAPAAGTQTSTATPAESGSAGRSAMGMFSATLNGKNMVPPMTVNDSGSVRLQVSQDSTQITYTVTAWNATDITQIHMHYAPKGQNGDMVVFLYPQAPPPKTISGVSNGVVASGTIDSSRLIGPFAGKKIKDLVHAMANDSIAVMLHTVKNPNGEIRGQVTSGSGG